MKKFILIQAAILTCSVIFGAFGKMSFHDSGISGIQSYKDAANFATPIYVNSLFTEADQDALNSSDEIVAQKGQTSCILVVKSTGAVSQNYFFLSQQVVVGKTIKGDQAMTGTTINIYSRGFANIPDMSDGPTFYGECNLMKPGDEYLVFVDDMGIDSYVDVPGYWFGDGFFSCLNLTRNSNDYIEEASPTLFRNLNNLEYFANSQEIIHQINQIKSRIIAKYDP